MPRSCAHDRLGADINCRWWRRRTMRMPGRNLDERLDQLGRQSWFADQLRRCAGDGACERSRSITPATSGRNSRRELPMNHCHRRRARLMMPIVSGDVLGVLSAEDRPPLMMRVSWHQRAKRTHEHRSPTEPSTSPLYSPSQDKAALRSFDRRCNGYKETLGQVRVVPRV